MMDEKKESQEDSGPGIKPIVTVFLMVVLTVALAGAFIALFAEHAEHMHDEHPDYEDVYDVLTVSVNKRGNYEVTAAQESGQVKAYTISPYRDVIMLSDDPVLVRHMKYAYPSGYYEECSTLYLPESVVIQANQMTNCNLLFTTEEYNECNKTATCA
jgi:hypothetical protein